jgi:hypothetical protein
MWAWLVEFWHRIRGDKPAQVYHRSNLHGRRR